MTTIALDYIHAARHALDEGAIQTARCLLDSAEKHLSKSAIATDAAVTIPKQSIKIASPAIQPSLLTQARGINEWLPIIRKWIQRLPEGRSFTHFQLCGWIEGESGIILSDADQRPYPGEKTPTWRRHVSRALRKLKKGGTLSSEAGAEDLSRSCTYVVTGR